MTVSESVRGEPSGSSPSRLVVRDPRTDEVVGEVPIRRAEDVAETLQRARIVAGHWGRLPFDDRAEHLLAVRDVMLDRIDDLVDTIVMETGKLRAEALVNEVMVVAETIGYYARQGGRSLRPERARSGLLLHKRARRTYEPMGVVGVISPWNYPFTLAMTPVVTAALAGNSVILKPSEVTPLTGVLVGELFREAARGGEMAELVQVVTGDGTTGEALVRCGVDKICFTGSARTGRRVMAAAAENLTPVLLELGGKDPMIVLPDADLSRAASAAVWGAFQNSGQTCMSVERVYVHSSVAESFTEQVVAMTRAVAQGTGPSDDMGSMTFPPQIGIVERHLDEAVANGARVLIGGRRVPGRTGQWFEPTVVTGVDHTMALMREETFGPVLPIMTFDRDDEAIRLANDSVYGLNSSVWTSDRIRGQRVAAAIAAGNVCVNDVIVSYGISDLPFGGVKQSGIGRVHGPLALREFSNTKSVLEDRGGLGRGPRWFPTPRWLASATRSSLILRHRRGLANKWRALRGRGSQPRLSR